MKCTSVHTAGMNGVMRYAIINGMKIGDHVIRTDKYDGRNTEHSITNAKELEYHQKLQADGFIYTIVGGKKDDFDFSLPTTSGVASAPRIHIAGDTCVNCEG